jgi:hypothetical protein
MVLLVGFGEEKVGSDPMRGFAGTLEPSKNRQQASP